MEGVERYKVSLLPHNEGWALEFIAAKRLLQETLGPNALEIEHIGSTAIRGIHAKPILDVAVKIASFSNLNLTGMIRHGYEDCGEAGVPGRRLFVLRGEDAVSLHHIHCYERDNREFEDHVRFRDYLYAHPEYAKQYDDLKRSLAEKYPDDRIAYTKGKEDFILCILKMASP